MEIRSLRFLNNMGFSPILSTKWEKFWNKGSYFRKPRSPSGSVSEDTGAGEGVRRREGTGKAHFRAGLARFCVIAPEQAKSRTVSGKVPFSGASLHPSLCSGTSAAGEGSRRVKNTEHRPFSCALFIASGLLFRVTSYESRVTRNASRVTSFPWLFKEEDT